MKHTKILLLLSFITTPWYLSAAQHTSQSKITTTTDKSNYQPNSEQTALLNSLREFVQKNYQSDIIFEFEMKNSIRLGTLNVLKTTRPEKAFFNTSDIEIPSAEKVRAFLRKHKALFQIDDESIVALKQVGDEYQQGVRLLQIYKGIPVFNSTIFAEAEVGITEISSSLVPTSKLSSVNLTPRITPENVVALNWKGWLSKGSSSSLKSTRVAGSSNESFSVKLTRFVLENGSKKAEHETANVHLVIYAARGEPRLAWCLSGNSGIHDAITGERIEGSMGPLPPGVKHIMNPSKCPYFNR